MAIVGWLKSNWVIVVVVLAVGYLGFLKFQDGKLYDSLMKKYNDQHEQHEKEIRDLEKVNEEMRAVDSAMNRRFQERIEELDRKYQSKLDEIVKVRQKTKTVLIEEAKKDPKKLTAKVEEVFGIPVLQNGDAR